MPNDTIHGVTINGIDYDIEDTTVVYDDTPTANSNNPVKSQGIKTAIDDSQKAQESLLRDTVGWTGKNLLSYDNYEDKSGTAHEFTSTGVRVYSTSNGTYRGAYIYLDNYPKNNALKLTTDIAVTSGKGLIGIYGSNDNTNWSSVAKMDNGTATNVSIDLDVPSTNYAYYRININCTVTTSEAGDVTFSNLMLRRADIAESTYEPYHESVDEAKAESSSLAPVENGSTASRAYAVGEHFYRDGAFCTCISAIASGGNFTLNTNYTAGTVESALKELIDIPSGSNLNNYVTPGNYKASGSSISSSLSNCPISTAGFRMEVVYGYTINVVIQKIYPNSLHGAIYYRTLTASSGTQSWSPWYIVKSLQNDILTTSLDGSSLRTLRCGDAYWTDTPPTNAPEGVTNGVIEFLGVADHKIQRVTTADTIYVRQYNGSEWGSWYKFTGTIVT